MDKLRADNIVWIFGTGRSGSTWLGSMMGEPAGFWLWDEPLVGKLFGEFYEEIRPRNLDREDFVMARQYRKAWLDGIRSFVMNVAASRFPEAVEGDHFVIKEPNGTIGAPLLAAATPGSRVVLLVRDPRDVAASAIDRHRKGGGAYESRRGTGMPSGRPLKSRADEDPEGFAKGQAKRYMRNMGKAKEAYDTHQGPRVLIRYEDLRIDTLRTMQRIYSNLGIPMEEGELARVVEKHSWENIPEEEKGLSKFNRKATPGGWREDLTPRQAEIVEEATAPLLAKFYGR